MDFSSPRTAQTNGITMEYFEQGSGVPVLLLHGFPEHAYSWRHQVDPIAEAGFRVIVPNQRGYAGTDATADLDDYSVKKLVADISGLLDALGIDSAVWFGHDWGSMPAWYSGVYDRDRVLGVGSLCTPYFTPGEVDLVEIYDTLRGPKHYMRTFQEPPYAEELLGRDVEHTFRSLMRGRGYTLEQFKQAPPEVQELPAGWFVGDPQLFGEEILTDDWALPVDFTEGMENLLPQLEKHVIADAAHWLQQEKPEEVSELLLGWLRRNF